MSDFFDVAFQTVVVFLILLLSSAAASLAGFFLSRVYRLFRSYEPTFSVVILLLSLAAIANFVWNSDDIVADFLLTRGPPSSPAQSRTPLDQMIMANLRAESDLFIADQKMIVFDERVLKSIAAVTTVLSNDANCPFQKVKEIRTQDAALNDNMISTVLPLLPAQSDESEFRKLISDFNLSEEDSASLTMATISNAVMRCADANIDRVLTDWRRQMVEIFSTELQQVILDTTRGEKGKAFGADFSFTIVGLAFTKSLLKANAILEQRNERRKAGYFYGTEYYIDPETAVFLAYRVVRRNDINPGLGINVLVSQLMPMGTQQTQNQLMTVLRGPASTREQLQYRTDGDTGERRQLMLNLLIGIGALAIAFLVDQARRGLASTERSA